MFQKQYKVVKKDDGWFEVYKIEPTRDYDIGGYELSTDGCRAFGVNEAGTDYYIGHTHTPAIAEALIQKAFANIMHFCNLKGDNDERNRG